MHLWRHQVHPYTLKSADPQSGMLQRSCTRLLKGVLNTRWDHCRVAIITREANEVSLTTRGSIKTHSMNNGSLSLCSMTITDKGLPLSYVSHVWCRIHRQEMLQNFSLKSSETIPYDWPPTSNNDPHVSDLAKQMHASCWRMKTTLFVQLPSHDGYVSMLAVWMLGKDNFWMSVAAAKLRS